MMAKLALCLALACRVSGSVLNAARQENLPVVDLGYELHQALSYNKESKAYSFENIRYARPPTGDLRFRAPQKPEVDRSSVQTGADPRTCPQGLPLWQALGGAVSSRWTDPSRQFSEEEWVRDFYTTNATARDVNAGPGGVSEDCLFLDVFVPKKTLKAANKCKMGAPVLVWIHGGGYDLGSKQRFPTPQFIPTGLLARAGRDPEGIVYVGLNYRLGAFGWLSGPEVDSDGDANAGLLDQHMALEWVQEHIHKFGGDRNRVTVMGESAGGGSILHHMMAYGGGNRGLRTPFAQAISQSPFIEPTSAPVDGSYEKLLSMLGAGSLQELRRIDEQTLIAANAALIYGAPANTYLFGPVVDGKYVPERPMKLLREGRFDKSVAVLTTHTAREGAYFFDPSVGVGAEDEFSAWVGRSIPGLPEESIRFLAEELYPPVFDGSWGYASQEARQMSLWGEAFFDCHFAALGEITDGKAYASEFAISPGFHTQDLAYIFDFPGGPPVPFPKAKDAVQDAIVSFAQTGTPRMADGTAYPRWGSDQLLVNITGTETYVTGNGVNMTRCDWWMHMDV